MTDAELIAEVKKPTPPSDDALIAYANYLYPLAAIQRTMDGLPLNQWSAEAIIAVLAARLAARLEENKKWREDYADLCKASGQLYVDSSDD